jgi:hypothetical protein
MTENLIYIFLIRLIQDTATNKTVNEKILSAFIHDFNKLYYAIKIKHANIFSKIKKINNGEYIKLIYSGYEQTN